MFVAFVSLFNTIQNNFFGEIEGFVAGELERDGIPAIKKNEIK